MSATTPYKIPLFGVPACWLLQLTNSGNPSYALDIAEPGGTTDKAKRLKFDNLASNPTIKLKSPASSSEKYEITRADDTKITFPKVIMELNGVDESQIASTASSSGYAEITIETNEGDMDSDTWGKFIEKLVGLRDEYFLGVFPIAYTYDKRYVNATRNADGFVFCVVKLTSDIELSLANAPGKLSLTFQSFKYELATSGWETACEALDFTKSGDSPQGEITLKGTSYTVNPYTLVKSSTVDDVTPLQNGEAIIKTS